jgi:GntR family transcriptional regulator/MocR family aminotransferase
MDQVVIVSGIQQALDIICRLILEKDDVILVESPGYVDAYNLFRTFGIKLLPVLVDDLGLPVESIKETNNCRLAFVTPSNQFPRGGTMSLNRRLSLLDWAQRSNAYILEDDYDGELRYSSHPIAALQGLDKEGRVIYLGTFSKVLFPALRLGYLVLPAPILPIFLKAKELVDRGAPTLTQAAVADFISEGHFERHLRRLRKEYGRRRKTLVEALDTYLPGLVDYSDVEAGLHIMVFLPADQVEEWIVSAAASLGVGVYPGSAFYLEGPSRPSLLLGFSGLGTPEIVEGVRRLADVVKKTNHSS